MNDTPLQRMFRKVELDADGCWIWTAGTSGDNPNDPYGRFWVDGRMVYAHRFAYEQLVGAIPPGHDLDHLCRRRLCVNPRHLEPVTRRENLMRGDTLARAHAEGRDCGYPGCRNCGRFAAPISALTGLEAVS